MWLLKIFSFSMGLHEIVCHPLLYHIFNDIHGVSRQEDKKQRCVLDCCQHYQLYGFSAAMPKY
jgi:hypothetical protein